MVSRKPVGFTLIELLIVVAIIAILAAIAVPNFLEAQTRAKVARAYSDMRTVATGLESYQVDNNKYPPLTRVGSTYVFFYAPYALTTPVSYVTAGPLYDLFKINKSPDNEELIAFGLKSPEFFRRFEYFSDRAWRALQPRNATHTQWLVFDQVSGTYVSYISRDERHQGAWYLSSYGPDLKAGPELPSGSNQPNSLILYDPTNGTVSRGDIVRTQKDAKGDGVMVR